MFKNLRTEDRVLQGSAANRPDQQRLARRLQLPLRTPDKKVIQQSSSTTDASFRFAQGNRPPITFRIGRLNLY
jgi:hypothetical protein